jgi:hypothetical protein
VHQPIVAVKRQDLVRDQLGCPGYQTRGLAINCGAESEPRRVRSGSLTGVLSPLGIAGLLTLAITAFILGGPVRTTTRLARGVAGR